VVGVGYASVVVAMAVGVKKESAIGGRHGVTGCNPISRLKVVVANTSELVCIQYDRILTGETVVESG